MAEIAYNLQLKKPMSAIEAHDLSITGEITGNKCFRCIDEKCKAPLTLSNFGISKSDGAKRITFSESKQNFKHVSHCNINLRKTDLLQNYNEEDFREEVEIRKAQNYSEVIEFISKDISTKESINTDSIEIEENEDTSKSYNQKQHNNKHNRRFTSLRSLVYVYQCCDDFQKQNKLIKIENNEYSLAELFVNLNHSNRVIPEIDIRIYYGNVTIHSVNKKSDLIYFKFSNNVLIAKSTQEFKIFSNKLKFSNKVKDCIDDGNEYMFFCAVKIVKDSSSNKFKNEYKIKGFKKTIYNSLVLLNKEDKNLY